MRFIFFVFSAFLGVFGSFFGGILWAGELGQNLKNISLDFEQIVESEGMPPLIFRGNLVATDTSHARWIYTAPIQKQIFVSPREVWIYEVALNQATKMQNYQNLNFIDILNSAKRADAGVKNLAGDSGVKNPVGDSSKPASVGNPAGDSNAALYVATIDGVEYNLLVDAAMLPIRLTFKDGLENYTTIKFSNVKKNQKLDSKLFIFTPPSNIEISEQ